MLIPGNKHALEALTVGVVNCGSLKDWNLQLKTRWTDFNELQHTKHASIFKIMSPYCT
jgi:hypothetical protein